jgi:predicted tellurium resistance membrane protein TerC
MSLDNVIAVAAVAQGSLTLLTIGLVASIPIIIAGAALIMTVLERYPILVWAGAALLGWISGEIIATDTAVSGAIAAASGEAFARQVEFAAGVATALLVVGLGGLWQQYAAAKARARTPRGASGGAA